MIESKKRGGRKEKIKIMIMNFDRRFWRFEHQKKFALKRLSKALEKNEVDMQVISLINYINSLEDFYTTSTCSGRISILQDVGSKKDNFHLGKWHREVKFSEVKKAIENLPKEGVTWFKQESSILHIVSRTLERGKFLLTLGLSSGFKHSGIQGFKDGRFLIEICSSERIDAPIAENGVFLVNEHYLKYITKLANEKFLKSQEKLKNFEKVLRKNEL
jgi:tRNA wybutosine-synthesizing protein 3